jgi:transcriptional regulator with XRE-family HTH domain
MDCAHDGHFCKLYLQTRTTMSAQIEKSLKTLAKETKNNVELSDQVIGVLGNKITWLREMRDWDIGKLAKRANVTRQTLSNYQKPNWECSVSTIKKISDACGIHPSYFFYDLFPDDYLLYSEDFRLIVLELGKIEEGRRQLLRDAIISLIASFQVSESRNKSSETDNSKTPQVPFPDHYISQKKLYKSNERSKKEK